MDTSYIESVLLFNFDPFSLVEQNEDGYANVYTIKQDNYNGFGIAYDDPEVGPQYFSRRFRSSIFNISYFTIDGTEKKLLCFLVDENKVYDVFLSVAKSFLSHVINEDSLIGLMSEPSSFSDRLADVFGNDIANPKNLMSIIAEALVFTEIQELSGVDQRYSRFEWTPNSDSTIDISNDKIGVEVKSTKNKHTKKFKVSSIAQGDNANYEELWYAYVGLEKTAAGDICVDSIVDQLESKGLPDIAKRFLNEVYDHGCFKGSELYEQKYALNFLSWYINDSTFPKIRKLDFIQGDLPHGVVNINYEVSLDNIPSFKSIKDTLPNLEEFTSFDSKLITKGFEIHLERLQSESPNLTDNILKGFETIIRKYHGEDIQGCAVELRTLTEACLKWFIIRNNTDLSRARLRNHSLANLWDKAIQLNPRCGIWKDRLRDIIRDLNTAVHDREPAYDQASIIHGTKLLLTVIDDMTESLRKG